MGKILSPELQQNYAEALRRAQSGDLKFAWLFKLAINAGFAPVRGREAGSILLVTPKALADGFRVTERTVRNWIKEGMPVHQYSVGNRPALYDVFDIVRWREKRYEATGEVDPLMRGGNSPALEAYRQEQVKKARRENAKADGALVESAIVSAQLAEIGRAFRTRAELIERTHGKVIGNVIREMVDFAVAQWEKLGFKGRRKNRRAKCRQ